ncbi:MAG: hypothetical protein M3235_00325 [Actinomycetota bacterium]|nr:hypothetical protein [Actinomycetota bacterium]
MALYEHPSIVVARPDAETEYAERVATGGLFATVLPARRAGRSGVGLGQ